MYRIVVVLALSLAACGASTGEDAVGGSASAPLDLSVTVACVGSATVSGTTLLLKHAAHYFADGSVVVTCSIQDDAREYSSTNLYGPDSPDAADAFCALVYDVDAPSSGTWYFSQGVGASAVSQGYYLDTESPMSGYIAPLGCVAH